MKTIHVLSHHGEFRPLVATAKAQMALMELPPGGKSDEEISNEHPDSEQWLFVLSGSGAATVVAADGKRRRVQLRRGMLLVIEAGELHRIANTGRRPLSTINFYVPPAYRSDGHLRRRSPHS